MKIIMFMGIPSSNNLELAEFMKVNIYPNALIFNQDHIRIRPQYKDLPINAPAINFALIKQIKKTLQVNPADVIMIIAPFISKESREYFYEAFKEAEFIGIWVERSKEELMLNNSLQLPSFQLRQSTIEYYLKYKVSPTLNEPFKDIAYISREINAGMSKLHPYPMKIEELLMRL